MNNKHTSHEEIDNDKYEYHQNTLENSMNAMRLDGENKNTTQILSASLYSTNTEKNSRHTDRN